MITHVPFPRSAYPWFVPFVSVDPGKKTGWSFFDDTGRLIACGLTDGDAPVFPIFAVGRPLLVIEHPHEGRGKASPKDLMTLARRMQNAIHAARAERVEEIIPQRWKGCVPKMVRTPAGVSYPALDRIRAKMSPEERDVFARCTTGVAKTTAHNVLDSVGLGVWWTECKGYPYRVTA